MSTKTLWIILAILIVAAGALFVIRMQSTLSTEPVADARFVYGAYPYACDNETGFVMEPSQDTQMLRITGTPGSSIDQTVLSNVTSAEGGAHYEGGEIKFHGIGETVHLTVDGKKVTCAPLPNADEAPFNFGD